MMALPTEDLGYQTLTDELPQWANDPKWLSNIRAPVTGSAEGRLASN